MRITRRRFFHRSAAAAGAAVSFPTVAAPGAAGANDDIRVAVIGMGGRGGHHIDRMEKQQGVRVVALCDPDCQRLGARAAALEKRAKRAIDRHADMREVFDRRDIDVISNATQNYWHGLSTIWACQAGKHVYLEKPISHYIWEGRQIVNAARKYNRFVQTGTQQRSRPATYEAIEWLQAGNLGKIEYVTCFANKPRSPVGKRKEPLPIPDSVDYELWCGPARKEPIYRNRLQYDCSFVWNTGDGESCNQGVHEIDIGRWVLGERALPRRVMSIGGRFLFNDAADAPNTQIIYYDFPSAPILYEVHNLRAAKGSSTMPNVRGLGVGTVVQCQGGSMTIVQSASRAYDTKGKEIKSWSSGERNFETFITAVRSGKRSELTGDVLEGHLSTAICHAGNISYRLGKAATVAQQRKQTRDIPAWKAMHERFLAHLAANEIDPNTAILGPWLEGDREKECFKDNDEANRLVRGFYRAPFRVPEVTI
jgi:predicted dehydrogenase